jgi:hypothetical protein
LIMTIRRSFPTVSRQLRHPSEGIYRCWPSGASLTDCAGWPAFAISEILSN